MSWFFRKKSSSASAANDANARTDHDLTMLAGHFALGKELSETKLPSENYFSYHKTITFSELSRLTEVLARETDAGFEIDVHVVSATNDLQQKFSCNSASRSKGCHTLTITEELLAYPVHLTASIVQQLCQGKINAVYKDVNIITHAATVLGFCYGYGTFHILSLEKRDIASNAVLSPMTESAMCYCAAFIDYLGINSAEKYQFYLPAAAWASVHQYMQSMHNLPGKQKFHQEWHKSNASAWDYYIISKGRAYEQETMDAVKRLSAVNKRDYTLLHYLAYGQLQREMYPEAIKGFTEVISANPFFEHAFNNRGLAYILTGNFGPGLQDLQTAERIKSDFNLNRRNFGIYWLLRGDPDRALRELEKAWQSDPKTEHIYYWLGKAYYALGNRQEALRHFEFSRSVPELPAPVYPM